MLNKIIVNNIDYNVINKYIFDSENDISQEIIEMLKKKHNCEQIIMGNINGKIVLMAVNKIEEILPIKEDII